MLPQHLCLNMYPQLLILRSPTVLLWDSRASHGTVLHFCPASWRLVRKNPEELLSLSCWEPYPSCAGSLLCLCCVSIGYTSPQERLGHSVFTVREWSWTSIWKHRCLMGCSCRAFPTIMASCMQRSAVDTEWDLSRDQKRTLRLPCEHLNCCNISPAFFFFLNLYLLFLMVWEGCIGKFW